MVENVTFLCVAISSTSIEQVNQKTWQHLHIANAFAAQVQARNKALFLMRLLKAIYTNV